MRRALCLVLALLALLPFGGMANAEAEITGRMALDYAENFSVDYYAGGAARLRIAEQDVLLLPEGADVPEGLETLPRIPIPAENLALYLHRA